MKINYEKSFKKLVEQINFEYELAMKSKEVDEKLFPGKMTKFNEGMEFAYGSIRKLANMLADGEFDFELRGYETVIVDRMGYYHDGYICDECSSACPYVVKDIDGIDACYKDTYRQCPAKVDYEED